MVPQPPFCPCVGQFSLTTCVHPTVVVALIILVEKMANVSPKSSEPPSGDWHSSSSSSSPSWDDSSSSSSSSWDETDAIESGAGGSDQTSVETMCLFCPQTHATPECVLSHIQLNHNLDIVEELRKRDLDCMSFIRLVNFTRKEKPSPESVFKNIHLWHEKDEFMKPTSETDPFLTYDIETQLCQPNGEPSATGSVDHDNEVRHLKATIKSMRESMRSIIEEKSSKKQLKNKRRHMERTNETHAAYFNSYSHFSIHHQMLSDTARTNAYRNAIVNNGDFFKDKLVLDAGSGTGILAMFAANAGASKVIAIENSDIAFYAMLIVSENSLKHKVDVIKSRIEDYQITQPFDILISEWMGYFLIYEGMLDTVIKARDTLMKKDAVILPNRSEIIIAAICNDKLYQEQVLFWNDVYGFKMTSLKEERIAEPYITTIESDCLCSESQSIFKIDLLTATLDEIRCLTTEITLTITKTCQIHAIVGWFDCFFDHPSLKYHCILSTSPSAPESHWRQCIFMLRSPVDVKQGDQLPVKISISRPPHEVRAMKVELTIANLPMQEYVLM